jgi:hypothetical protein
MNASEWSDIPASQSIQNCIACKGRPGDYRLDSGEELKERSVDDIRTALEAAGVEFIPENGGGPGVRLRKP